MKRRVVGLVVILVVVGGVWGGYWYYGHNPDVLIQAQLKFGVISEAEARGMSAASGIIEADEVSVTTEMGGRVAQVLANEGDLVQGGDIVIRLDDDLLQAQIAQSEAAVEAAQATLAQVRAGVPEAEIRQAEMLVAQAEVARDGALQALRECRSGPQ